MLEWIAQVELHQWLGIGMGLGQIVSMWLAGNGRTSAWVIALAGNAFWYAYVFTVHTWTLLPLVMTMTFVYARNVRRGIKKDRAAAVKTPSPQKLEPPAGQDPTARSSGRRARPAA